MNVMDDHNTQSFTQSSMRPILHSTIKRCPLLRKLYKIYFDAKHLEKRLPRGLVPFFHKKVYFLLNIECSPKFLEHALVCEVDKY